MPFQMQFVLAFDGLAIHQGCFPVYSPRFWDSLQHPYDPTKGKQFGKCVVVLSLALNIKSISLKWPLFLVSALLPVTGLHRTEDRTPDHLKEVCRFPNMITMCHSGKWIYVASINVIIKKGHLRRYIWMTSQLCPEDTAPVYNDASSLTTTSAARVMVCPETLLQGIYRALCSSQNSL